jgi:hypothetical protein
MLILGKSAVSHERGIPVQLQRSSLSDTACPPSLSPIPDIHFVPDIYCLGQIFTVPPRKVRLPRKGNSNSHGARPVHQIITIMKLIRTSRLSIENSPSLLSLSPCSTRRVLTVSGHRLRVYCFAAAVPEKLRVQGYLAHKNPPHLGSPHVSKHRATVGSYGGEGSYE